jgi:hypothetical protein
MPFKAAVFKAPKQLVDIQSSSTTMTDYFCDNKTEITLRGSVEIVSDFFFTAINSILYQRGEESTLSRSMGSFVRPFSFANETFVS